MLDTALDADGELLELRRQALGERRHRRHELSLSARTTALTDRVAGHGTDPTPSTEIAAIPAVARLHGTTPPGQRPVIVGPPPLPEPDEWSLKAASTSVALLADLAVDEIDPLTVGDIEERVDALAKGYFRASPMAFRTAVVQLRQRVADLVAIRSTPSQRRRLYAALAALTGMLAESSFAIGDQTDIHCAAAIALAAEAGHPDLVAWVRGTQAQIALHTGNPAGAVRYARAGQATAVGGSTAAVRSSAYLARASARLGDRTTARQACRSAHAAWERLDGSLTDSVFSLNADYLSYCELTTMVWLGEVRPAQRLADQVVQSGNTPTVGRAITQIDIALVRVLSGEIDGAVSAGQRALSIGSSRLTTPLRDRVTDLIESLAPFDVPGVDELRERWMWISG